MTPQIMLDLETLGVGHDPVLLSIGAVKFTDTEILDKFDVAIDPETCQAVGLKIDAATVKWWLDPDRAAAREALQSREAIDLGSALIGFASWIGETPIPVWGNGAGADNVWLRSAYRAMGLECPFGHWMDRCYRTMKNLAPQVVMDRAGTHHNAVDDAADQARHLQAIFSAAAMGIAA